MKDVAFGQLYPVDSVVHRLDPRVKLLVTIAYIVLLFFSNSFVTFGVIALSLLVVIFLSRVPLLKVLASLRFIIILLLFTMIVTVLLNDGAGREAELAAGGFYLEWGVFTICTSGLYKGGLLLVRLVLVVIGPTMLTFTTTPVALTDALESLLKPLALMRLPVHEFAMIMAIALRLIPTLMEKTSKIMSAQKARGASFDHGNIFKRAKALLPVLIPLFVSSFRIADDLTDAMDSRCYSGSKGRTRLKVMHIRVPDVIASLIMVALFFLVLLVVYNWWGWEWVTVFNADKTWISAFGV